jgi:(2Fe-2S) ferredoxin
MPPYPPIKLEIAQCLSMCGAGPNAMLYPAGIALNNLSPATLQPIAAAVDHYCHPPSEPEAQDS